MQRWLLFTIAVLGGSALGLGAFTFSYAKGYSYLLDEPSACANCHIMKDHYSAWLKSSHRAVASRNSCHTPHALVPRYYVKAKTASGIPSTSRPGRSPTPSGSLNRTTQSWSATAAIATTGSPPRSSTACRR
jgi:hypothetical protein